MSSIWTPSGEHLPQPEPEGPGEESMSPEEFEAAMAQARAELAATPVADIVANHAIGLWQLALLHLGLDRRPDAGEAPAPNLTEASLAVDAMGALVEGLGERLGEHHKALADALAQLRVAYVQIAQAGPPAGEAEQGQS
jgi:uncharacterized protein DUF1844